MAIMEPNPRWDRLIKGLRLGDEEVVAEFFRSYGKPLQELADRHIAAGLRRRMGPESAALSACRTFLRRAQEGQFSLQGNEELWRLLCAITLSKVREQARFHLRQRRGIGREVELRSESDSRETLAFDQAAPEPGPDEAAAIAECFEQLFESLEEEERQMVELKLQDFNNLEIAERMGCSERTVRRLMGRVRARLEGDLDVS